jgi:hypothetical protein
MAAVFCVAVDFALILSYWDSPGPQAEVGIVTLPMANLLLMAVPRLGRRGAARWFWIGFEAAGWLSVLAVGFLSWRYTKPFFWLITPVVGYTGSMNEVVAKTLIISFAVVAYTIPQILVALLGGWLASRFHRGAGRQRAA